MFIRQPVAAVALAALEVLEDEKLEEHAEAMGKIFRAEIAKIKCPRMVTVRGKGLLNAVVFEKGSANGSWVRAADQSVKVDNVTYFTSIPTNAGGLSHWRATRLIIRGGQIHDADS